MTYCKGLKFEDRPDYGYLRRLFRELMYKMDLEWDGIFDWTLKSIPAPGTGEPGAEDGGDAHKRNGEEMKRDSDDDSNEPIKDEETKLAKVATTTKTNTLTSTEPSPPENLGSISSADRLIYFL
jgi:hypothetical protein